MSVAERKIGRETDARLCFREEYRGYVAGLPSEIQEMFAYVPSDSLAEHAEFHSELKLKHPALHNHHHVMAVLEFAFRYIAYSTEENDPLGYRADLAKWEEMTGQTYTNEEVIFAFAVGLTEHDKCEIATGYHKGMNGPVLDFRTDGYRGRREIEGYPVPEKLSAEIAQARIGTYGALTPEQKMRIGLLSHHIAMETTWMPTDNPFSAIVRTADRNNGWLNRNGDKDCGLMCELAAVNPTISVNARVEYNFHQLEGPKVLPDGVKMADVASIIYTPERKVPDHVFYIEDEYPNKVTPVRQVLRDLHKQALISLPQEFFASVISQKDQEVSVLVNS